MKKYIKIVSMCLVAMFALALVVPGVVGAATTADPLTGLNTAQTTSGATDRDLPTLIGAIIQWILGIVGFILLIMFIYGGVTYATSAGVEDKVESGKKIMLYAIVGVVIIALAFALTRYVLSALFTS